MKKQNKTNQEKQNKKVRIAATVSLFQMRGYICIYPRNRNLTWAFSRYSIQGLNWRLCYGNR